MASLKELDLVLGNAVKIGQNSFQFDHDRIRHVDKYKAKCINVLFKQTTQESQDHPESVLAKVLYKLFKTKRTVKKRTPSSFSQTLDYLSLPSANMDLLSLVTKCSETSANPIFGIVNNLSVKLIFYKIHRYIVGHLDKSNIHESVSEELLSFQKTRKSGVIEPLFFTDSVDHA